MAIADDISIDNTTKVIDYEGTDHGVAAAGYYTGIEFHRWLGSLADDAQADGADDDFMDMTKLTPSARNGIDQIIEMLNGYTITQDLSEHLYDCSIIQAGGDDIWDGMTVIAGEGCDCQIIQNGAVVADPFWNSIPNGETEKGLNRDVAGGIASRFLLKVTTGGTDIDGRRIIGTTRVWGKTFSEFKVNGTARGNNVIALNFQNDTNNTSVQGTVDGWSAGFVNTEGYANLDVNFDTTDEYYYSNWNVDKGTYSINDAYEFWKSITVQGETDLIYGLEGQIFRGITHQIDYSTLAGGTFTEGIDLDFSNGAVAQVLADDGVGTMWVQLLTGVAPTNAHSIDQDSTVTADIDTIAEKPISQPFCGASTGSALLGAYGFGILAADVTNNDRMVALDGLTYYPPNNQYFYVNGLVSAEDYVLVGQQNDAATDIKFGQFAVSTALTEDTGTSIIVKLGTEATVETPGTGTVSALDTPASGTIRVEGDDGIYHRVPYSVFTVGAGTMTFTVTATDVPTAAVDNNVFISYIDKDAASTSENFLATYSETNRTLFARVRDGKATPIKTFEAKNATFGSAGGTVNVSRVTDE